MRDPAQGIALGSGVDIKRLFTGRFLDFQCPSVSRENGRHAERREYRSGEYACRSEKIASRMALGGSFHVIESTAIKPNRRDAD